MANQKQLDILKQGVQAWNEWRMEHPDIRHDLIGADLTEADLNNANLIGVDLTEANFSGAELSEAILIGANLRFANLSNSNLTGANLSEANLIGANLGFANLSNAELINSNLSEANLYSSNLSKANLRFADLSRADLGYPDFSEAIVGWTIFGNIDLSAVKNLETLKHQGPSTIGIDTIYRSQGNIPEVFLKGAGVDNTFIIYIRSLVGKPIEYYSCFISYSSKDDAFAKRLYTDLQSQNVRCWFAPEDLKWGERIRTGIDEAIRLHDKLLLILSKSSVASGWVEREVKTALAKERKEKRTVLFPVRVDRTVFESPFDWATEIRHERNIGDFTHWKNHDDYQKAFTRLLRDLKAEAMTG